MHSIGGLYHYHRIGHDERELELLPDGQIGKGADGAERHWEVSNGHEPPHLTIGGDYGPICELTLDPDGCWRGCWLKFERMPIELIPKRLQSLRSPENRGPIWTACCAKTGRAAMKKSTPPSIRSFWRLPGPEGFRACPSRGSSPIVSNNTVRKLKPGYGVTASGMNG